MKLKRGCRLWWLAIPPLAIDRLCKRIAVAALAPSGERSAIPGALSWAYTENSGTAFSMNAALPRWALIALTGILLGALLCYLLARPDNPTLERVGLWLIVGGGFGNLWDRIACGRVIDFIRLDFVNFAVFNPADIFVCVGAGLIVLSMLLDDRGKKHA